MTTNHPVPTPAPSEPAPSLRPVEELQALCDAATPEPWSFYLGDLWCGATAEDLERADRLTSEHNFSDEAEDIFERSGRLFLGDVERGEDAEFIAAARTALPSLLARLRAAEWTLAAVGALHSADSRFDDICAGCIIPGRAAVYLDRCRTRAILAEGASR